MADVSITAADVRLADPHAPIRKTAKAGAAIDAGEACYIDSGELAQLSVTDADGVGAQFDGIACSAAGVGDPVTLFGLGSFIYIGAHGETIGDFLYPSENAGKLAETGSTGEKPIAKCISDTVIMVVRNDLPAVDNTPK